MTDRRGVSASDPFAALDELSQRRKRRTATNKEEQ